MSDDQHEFLRTTESGASGDSGLDEGEGQQHRPLEHQAVLDRSVLALRRLDRQLSPAERDVEHVRGVTRSRINVAAGARARFSLPADPASLGSNRWTDPLR